VPEVPSERPSTVRDVDYKGEPLDSARGPGLGCFRIQLVLLVILVFVTPLSVVWHWPDWASTLLLFATLILLLISGQTIVFLLRLVAADRRAARQEATIRRRPLAAATKTVGELEDEARATSEDGAQAAGDAEGIDGGRADGHEDLADEPGSSGAGGVRE
jgi:hypothetical protein